MLMSLASFGTPGSALGAGRSAAALAPGVSDANEYVVHHPDQFGGIYIDLEANRQIVILTVPETTDASLAAVTGLLRDTPYRVRGVKYSFAHLEDLVTEIVNLWPYATSGINSAGVDTIANRVEVTINPDKFRATRALLVDRYPADVLHVIAEPPGHDVGGNPPPTDLAPVQSPAGDSTHLALIALFAIGGIGGWLLLSRAVRRPRRPTPPAR